MKLGRINFIILFKTHGYSSGDYYNNVIKYTDFINPAIDKYTFGGIDVNVGCFLDKKLGPKGEIKQNETTNTEALLNRVDGDINAAKGCLEKALKFYNKAIELDSCYEAAYANRANTKFKLNDYNGAEEDYKKAIEIDPGNQLTYNNFGLFKYHFKEYEEAIANFDKALEIDEDYAECYNSRGSAKCMLGDLEGSIIDFNNALEFNKDYVAAYQNRAISKNKLGDIEGAMEDCKLAYKYGQNSNKELFEVIQNFENEHYYKTTNTNKLHNISEKDRVFLESFDARLEFYHEDFKTYNNRGYLKYKYEDYENALDDFNRAIEINKFYGKAYNNRGTLKVKLNDYEGALCDFDEAIKLNEKNIYGYNERAKLNEKIGNKEAAKSDYNKIIDIESTYFESNNFEYRNNKRVKLKKSKLYEMIKADYPEYIRAYHKRGVIKYEDKEYEEAILDFNEVIKMDSEYFYAYYYKGISKLKLLDDRNAKKNIKSALRLAKKYNNQKWIDKIEKTLIDC